MQREKIDRINFLYKKSKEQPLTEEELNEQKALREEYIAEYKKNLVSQLNNTYVMDKDGNKRKLNKKEDKN